MVVVSCVDENKQIEKNFPRLLEIVGLHTTRKIVLGLKLDQHFPSIDILAVFTHAIQVNSIDGGENKGNLRLSGSNISVHLFPIQLNFHALSYVLYHTKFSALFYMPSALQ